MGLLLSVSLSKKKRVYFQHLFSVYCDVLQIIVAEVSIAEVSVAEVSVAFGKQNKIEKNFF